MKRFYSTLATLALACAGTLAAAGDFKVTLLGTGVPNPRPERFSQSTLVEAGTQKLVFDVGRGMPIRLWQVKVPMGRIDAHFLTHFHSDHLVGLPDLWLTGWLRPRYGQRTKPFLIYGPAGTRQLMQGLQTAFADDIKIRLVDEQNPPEGITVDAREFEAPAVVYERDGVKVSSFTVDHGDVIKPAVGYRIDYGGRSAVISGDTRLSEELVRRAKGVDLLIHEVAAINPGLLKRSPAFQRIFAHHVSPAQAGSVFTRTQPRMAVYSHIARYDDAQTPAPTDEDIVRETRETYKGPLVVGADLMQFDIGAEGIAINMAQ
ncbi:MBL fold metallo-hydrolase [Alicycliphilus denitrificans]|uniref:MBL fold metallo-hydrolase n=1 Tax=Alicycliphilus denitrificans TaxID=179636 RepID=A0A3R7F0X1_9BURK|nr:MBL fold metallo-hydrolase [Alicycliphilus denitrificans]RKJ98773.1 MBL fold metallo-hydrolase [Alicycliphilus denitrificans]